VKLRIRGLPVCARHIPDWKKIVNPIRILTLRRYSAANLLRKKASKVEGNIRGIIENGSDQIYENYCHSAFLGLSLFSI
jgi:hypothetical protein